MQRYRLIALKDFTFKGQSYAPGDRFEMPLGDAFAVLTRRQAKRVGTGKPSPETPKAAPIPEPVVPAPQPASMPDVMDVAETFTPQDADAVSEELPKRRYRRKKSAEESTDASESAWNSE